LSGWIIENLVSVEGLACSLLEQSRRV